MYFVFYKILHKIHVQNFAIAKNFYQVTWFKHRHVMFNKFKQDCFDVKATAS